MLVDRVKTMTKIKWLTKNSGWNIALSRLIQSTVFHYVSKIKRKLKSFYSSKSELCPLETFYLNVCLSVEIPKNHPSKIDISLY